jgi:5-hydroxyisourate hydrolase-like protein (transthyretin family)
MAADFIIKRHDTKPLIKATLADQSGKINLTTASGVYLLLKSASKSIKTEKMTFVSKPEGEVSHQFIAEETATPGTYQMEFEINWEDGTIQTVPNSTYLSLEIVEDLG